MIFTTFLFLPIILYFIIFFILYLFWIRSNFNYNKKTSSQQKQLNISIVIAARNEQNNIGKLLSAIKNQNFPKTLYEIVIIDDHSTDNTLLVCEDFFNKNIINHKIIKLNNEISGKKAAQKIGIENSSYDFIVLTDADCIPGANWLLTLSNFYITHKPKLIIGPIIMYDIFKKNNFINQIITLEHLSLISVSAASSYIQRPIMCSSANLAFEKKLYLDYLKNSISLHPSGDDMFLLIYAKKNYRKEIMYVHNIDAIVYTLPPMNFKEFVQQRIRWAAKSKFYSDIEIIIMAMLVFFTCTSLTIILIKSFFNHSLFILYLIGLFIKSIPDYLILQKITSDYKLKNLMKWFIPTQLFYPFYVIIIGIYSIFGKFNWKNRNFNARKQHKHLENNS